MWRCVCAVFALAAALPAQSDVIFRVPEVLVRHASAAKPVGTGRANATRANNSERWMEEAQASLLEVHYEEYFVEHDVSTADARKAAEKLKPEEMPSTLIGCGSCSRRELEYCETRLMYDHCCCERRFLPEPFPWLPHTCYVGGHRCRPIAPNCAQYTRIRDCCCYKLVAQKWKSILSSSHQVTVSVQILFLTLIVMMSQI